MICPFLGNQSFDDRASSSTASERHVSNFSNDYPQVCFLAVA